MHKQRAFTVIELLVVIAIIAVLVGMLFPTIAAVRRYARQQENNIRVRGIIQSMIQYSEGHRGFFPGFDGFEFTYNTTATSGLSGFGQTAEARYWILLDGNYTDPESITSPAETKSTWPNLHMAPADQQKVFTDNYSFAMLKIGTNNTSATPTAFDAYRREEWRNEQNSLAPLVSDRLVLEDPVTPTIGATDSYVSIHDSSVKGKWQGSIGFGDLSVEFSNSPQIPTRFAGYNNIDNPNSTNRNEEDDIFDASDSSAGNADMNKNAAMTYEGYYTPEGIRE